MPQEHRLTKKEKRELRRLEWQEKAKTEERNAKMQKYSIWAVVAVATIAVIFVLYQIVTAPSSPTPSQTLKITPVSKRDITYGNSKSKVTLIEYADFQCPACADYHPAVTQVLNDYKDKILYAYRMFPLTQAHQNALISAQAAYAAYNQGAFFKYDDLLYENQNNWALNTDPTSIFEGYAKDLKLDENKFKNDLNSEATKKYVQDSESEAISEGITSTPTFILNGKLIQPSRDYADFKKLIDDELNKK